MEFLKKIIVPLLITLSFVFTLLIIEITTDNNCISISPFEYTSIFEWLFIKVIIIFLSIIWFIVYVIYYKMSKKRKLNPFLIFGLVSILISFGLIQSIVINITDQNIELKKAICAKAKDDGMMCEINSLSYEEYQFFSNYGWFPQIPKETEKINIDYYRDDFLGDFILNIEIFIPKNETIDSIELKEWEKTKNNNILLNEFSLPIDTNYKIFHFSKISS